MSTRGVACAVASTVCARSVVPCNTNIIRKIIRITGSSPTLEKINGPERFGRKSETPKTWCESRLLIMINRFFYLSFSLPVTYALLRSEATKLRLFSIPAKDTRAPSFFFREKTPQLSLPLPTDSHRIDCGEEPAFLNHPQKNWGAKTKV